MSGSLASPTVSAVLYARVSHDPTGRGRSVESQLEACRNWADHEGWEVCAEVQDVDRSASRHAKRRREGWAEVVELVETGAIDVLVTWEASRAHRDLTAYAELRALCERTGTRWAYSGTVYDLSLRSDRFRTGLDALVAEDEADRTSERVCRAIASAAMNGRPTGRTPYGYRRVYDESTGELAVQVEHGEQAAVVREVARRFLAGDSLRTIARDLNARGVPTSSGLGTWSNIRLTRLLRTPTYNGQRVHRGQVVGPGNWPKLIDDDDWARLQARFADPSRRTSRARATKHLLTGIARCGVCGGPLRYGHDKGRRQYVCRSEGYHVARDARMLDAYVVDVLLRWLSCADEDLLRDEVSDEVVAARREVTVLRERLDDAAAAYVKGELSAAMLARVEGELTVKVADAERRTRYAALPSTVRDLVQDNVPTVWNRLTVEQRREVLRSILEIRVDRVAVPGRRGFDPSSVQIHWVNR